MSTFTATTQEWTVTVTLNFKDTEINDISLSPTPISIDETYLKLAKLLRDQERPVTSFVLVGAKQ